MFEAMLTDRIEKLINILQNKEGNGAKNNGKVVYPSHNNNNNVNGFNFAYNIDN
jgi:hypothetical protein